MKRNLFFVTASVLALSASAAMADGNTVNLYQYDATQTATINQDGSYNAVGNGGNFAQGAGASNNLEVNQTASATYNTVNGYQYGDVNTAELTQSGYNSNIVLQQNGTNNGRLSADARARTDTIVQNGTSYQSNVTLTQNGSNNGFDIAQGGYQNNATANQQGDTNKVTIKQALAYDSNYGYAYNRINSQQTGSYAKADITQAGSSNAIDSYQYGNGGTASQTLTANTTGGGNSIYNNQTGSDIAAELTQVGYSNYITNFQSGATQSVTVSQLGNGNGVYGQQYGDHNKVTIDQGKGEVKGYSNYANYYQSGSQLTLALTQTGSSNQSYTNQQGTGSKATITQK